MLEVKRYIPYLNLRWPCLVIWLTKMKELLGYLLKYTFLAAPFLGYSFSYWGSHIAVPILDYCLVLFQILYGKNLQKKSWSSCIRIGVPRGGSCSSYECHLHLTSSRFKFDKSSTRLHGFWTIVSCSHLGGWFFGVFPLQILLHLPKYKFLKALILTSLTRKALP